MKAIIFDLNGVFIISPKLSERFKDDFGISLEIFMPALQDVMDKVRQPGAKDVFYYWESYFRKWGIDFTETEFQGYCFKAEKPDDYLVGLAKKLKEKGYKLFILSNNFRGRADYYSKNFRFMDEVFEKVYYSWQTGYTKPDKAAWQLILEENHLKPEDCLYFDDSKKNIEAARFLGIDARIFDEDAVKFLEGAAS